MGTEVFWRNRTETRPSERALQTEDCELKTSAGIGQGLDQLIGWSIQGNVHLRLGVIGLGLDLLRGRSLQGNVH